MSYVKPTRANIEKFREYKSAEINFKKTIMEKSLLEQRRLIEQFSERWWHSK